jgi:hypothetical protein
MLNTSLTLLKVCLSLQIIHHLYAHLYLLTDPANMKWLPIGIDYESDGPVPHGEALLWPAYFAGSQNAKAK